MYPEKLILEPTTRCNFQCEMCVKQSAGCEIPEGDLDNTVFSKCDTLLPHLNSLIFTGIGEPLLNSQLEYLSSEARLRMPKNSIRGLQTNGKLLTPERAISLAEAGINKICISVDTTQQRRFGEVRSGGTLSDVDQAFDSLKLAQACNQTRKIQTGIEFVLMKKNLAELSDLIDFAADRSVDFIIVTHLTPYDRTFEEQMVILNTPAEGLDLFKAYQKKGAQQGIDISEYDKIYLRSNLLERDNPVYQLVQEMKESALKQDLYINLFHLLSEPPGEYDRLTNLFDTVKEKARSRGIELALPNIRPKAQRYCPFIEENAMFLSWDGNISPCYFLWHKYVTWRTGYAKQVNPVFFGNVLKTSPETVWKRNEYTSFREKVQKYDYPNCFSWCNIRCDYVLEAPFEQDCHIKDIPCGDCHWGLGFLNCLI